MVLTCDPSTGKANGCQSKAVLGYKMRVCPQKTKLKKRKFMIDNTITRMTALVEIITRKLKQ
jgi:hypothetical protein